jgi:hypothetical protein
MSSDRHPSHDGATFTLGGGAVGVVILSSGGGDVYSME